jgi:hypothetical protein
MRLQGREWTRRELMRRVGSLAQVGGITLLEHQDGHARGTRALDVRTGSGLRFVIEPDRGFDVGFAEYQGTGLCWMPAKGLAGPWYYETDLDDHAWLRVGLGGLFNTAGLVSMGTPQTVPTEQYGFTQRLAARYGTHDRIALTPASTFAHGQDWQGDRCLVWAQATVRQEIAYGEHLVLERRIETELGSDSFRVEDRVTNEGWFRTPHQLLYHWNLGFPLLGSGAEVIATTTGDPLDLSFSTDDGPGAGPSRWRTVTDPVEGFTHEGYIVPLRPNPEGWASVGLVNPAIRPDIGGLGVSLRYDATTLPVYVAWRMMREGLYAIGLEPSTTPFGATRDLVDQGFPVYLEPGESRRYRLELGILPGRDAIDAWRATLPSA